MTVDVKEGMLAPGRRATPGPMTLQIAWSHGGANGHVPTIHSASSHAYYQISTDTIHLPLREQFSSADRYYATALHELAHATGAPSRLNRDLNHPFGSVEYAKEELRAEIASMMIGDELGIGHDPEQHVAYVAHWVQSIRDDPHVIFRAASDASRIHDYVLGFEMALTEKVDERMHRRLMRAVEAGHAEAIAGYDPLESFQNLERVAAEHGLQAVLVHDLGDELIAVRYRTAKGDVLPVHTELSTADGKAASHVRGQRVVGTYFTSDPVSQGDALSSAFAAVGQGSKSREMQERGGSAHVESSATERLGVTEKLPEGDRTRNDGTNNSTPANDVQTGGGGDERVYLAVPYIQRGAAKALGARWDRQAKSWYVSAGTDLEPFARWRVAEAGQRGEAPVQGASVQPKQDGGQGEAQERRYLAVPYSDRGAAKAAGARWDREAKAWYAGPGADWEGLRAWWPSERETIPSPGQPPHLEFMDALLEMGGLRGALSQVRWDGQPGRMTAEGDRRRERAIFYVVNLESTVPHGYIKNHRTGEERRWVAKGYTLTEQQKAELQAAAAEERRERQQEQELAYVKVGNRVQARLQKLAPVAEPTPYMTAKQIGVHAGVYTNGRGETLVPAMNTDGFIWTMQVIQGNGTKRFVKGGRKAGCFHVVGGPEQLEAAPVLVIAEGYATAATLSELLEQPTVVAFDADNLGHVAKALHERYADKPVLVAGDDDLALLQNPKIGRNVGRERAEAAAAEVGGQALLPVFAPGEQQSNPKGFTDFNDLATRSSLGRDTATRQVRAAYQELLKKAQQAAVAKVSARRTVRLLKRGIRRV